MHIKKIIPFLLLGALLQGCSNPGPQEQDQQQEKTFAGDVFLDKKQLEHAGIEYGLIEKTELSDHVNARGELVLPVNATADLVSLYPGIVSRIHARQGDRVRKGEILATLSSPEFVEAQQEYFMVLSELPVLKSEYERQKELNEEKIASDKQYERVRSEYRSARMKLSSLRLKLNMSGVDTNMLKSGRIIEKLQIYSPISGYLELVEANPGKYIMKEERLMQVVNRDELLLELNVFEKDILNVHEGQEVSFNLSNLDSRNYQAKIVSIGNTVRQGTRIVKVLAAFNNAEYVMLPGMFVAAEIHTNQEKLDALPDEAIQRTSDDNYIIFYTTPSLQNEQGTAFMSVPVIPGKNNKGFTAVILKESLPDDALIVVSGGYYLKTEKTKQEE